MSKDPRDRTATSPFRQISGNDRREGPSIDPFVSLNYRRRGRIISGVVNVHSKSRDDDAISTPHLDGRGNGQALDLYFAMG